MMAALVAPHFNGRRVISGIKHFLLLLALFTACNCIMLANALEPEPQTQPVAAAAPAAPAAARTAAGHLVNIDSSSGGGVGDGVGAPIASSPTPSSSSGVEHNTATPYTEGEAEKDGSDPSEIQKAVCTVTAGEVKASAEAVTTKTLKGVCGSAEMEMAFRSLEAKLYKELHEIKLMLQQISPQYGGRNSPNSPHSIHTLHSYRNPAETTTWAHLYGITPPPAKTTTATAPRTTTIPTKHPTLWATNERSEKTATPPTNYHGHFKKPVVPKLKSLPPDEKARRVTPARDQEVSKFNNTMLSDRDFKVFTYYWKLENFSERIESAESATMESPIFSIKGKPLQIKAYFQHLHRDFLYLQLAYATLKSSNRNNIILDMGGLFKEIASDKITFKHKISILDQNNQRSKDLVSQEFNNLEAGFLIPNSALLADRYIKNDTLLIQIFLYL